MGDHYALIRNGRGRLLIHAATVSVGGRGVMLAGASGSGKSTLAAALVTKGADYLCDEFAIVDPTDLRLIPFPKALCVKAGSFGLVARSRAAALVATLPREGIQRAGRVRFAREPPTRVGTGPARDGDFPQIHSMALSRGRSGWVVDRRSSISPLRC
jgi:hypothetical protein